MAGVVNFAPPQGKSPAASFVMIKKIVQLNGWQKLKQLFGKLHLWLGLASGLVLFVICLSGSLLVFAPDIEELLSAGKYRAQKPAGISAPLPAETLMAGVQDSFPGHNLTTVFIPEDKDQCWQITMRRPDQKKEGARPDKASMGKSTGARNISLLVNPYTGAIQGNTRGSAFFPTVEKLHRYLLFDPSVGKIITGTAVLIFVFIIISGLIIWLPKKARQLRQGLVFKKHSHWKRRNYDLHRILGFYTAFPLLFIALLGLTWAFDWYNTGFKKMMGVYKPKSNKEQKQVHIDTAAARFTMADYLKTAEARLPYAGNWRIQLPGHDNPAVTLSKFHSGFWAPATADKVQINPATGEIAKVEIFAEKKLGEQIALSVRPLHTGNIYGGFTKIIYLLISLIAASLPITGTFIWWNKRKKTKGRNVEM